MGRLAAFDYGRARIGVSATDERQIIASPVSVVKVPKTKPLLMKEIEKVLSPLSPFDLFIVGLPLLLNGQEGDMAKEAKVFGKALEDHFSISCVFWDERLTSSQADRLMKDSSMSRKQRAGKVDTVASTLILQNYLDHQSIQASRSKL